MFFMNLLAYMLLWIDLIRYISLLPLLLIQAIQMVTPCIENNHQRNMLLRFDLMLVFLFLFHLLIILPLLRFLECYQW